MFQKNIENTETSLPLLEYGTKNNAAALLWK